MGMYLTWSLAASVLSGTVGWMVGSQREAATTGAVLGFLLGPLGVLISLAVDGRAQCGICGGRLNSLNGRLPSVCPHCHRGVADPDEARERDEPNLSFAAPRGGPELPEEFFQHAEQRATATVVRFYCPACNQFLEAQPGRALTCPSCRSAIHSPRTA